MTNDIVQLFAQHLSQLGDDDRDRALRQVRMLSMNAAPETAFEPPIRTMGQYLSDPIEVPPVLVEPYIVVRGGMTCTIGRAGKGKTVMNLNRIMRWSAGLPMFDGWKDKDGNILLAPDRPLKVLVIENEGAGGLFHRQCGIMLHAEGYFTDEQRDLVKENMLVWGDGGYSGLKLDDPAKLNIVRAGCEKWEPDIVFVEPFRGLWNGEENSATDMAVVVDALVEIAADYKCGILLAHHERKSGVGEDGEMMSAGRGSTVLEGAVTVMENFQSVKGGDFRELTWSKSRHGAVPVPVRMEWDPDAWWYNRISVADMGEAVLEVLRDAVEPMTKRALCEETGEKERRMSELLKNLENDGRIRSMAGRSDGTGSTGKLYRLPSDDNNESKFGGLSV
jgi:hypothetical protein